LAENAASPTIAAAAATESARRENQSSGRAPIASHTGGEALIAASAVMASTPSREPRRSAEYARSGGRRSKSHPTGTAASAKAVAIAQKSPVMSNVMPANCHAVDGSESAPQSESVRSGKRNRIRWSCAEKQSTTDSTASTGSEA
jgi:hypothetical protein